MIIVVTAQEWKVNKMADLLIRGVSEYATIIVTLGKAFNAISGEGYELVVLPTHGRLIDADKIPYFASEPWRAMATKSEIEKMPTVIEASEVEE